MFIGNHRSGRWINYDKNGKIILEEKFSAQSY